MLDAGLAHNLSLYLYGCAPAPRMDSSPPSGETRLARCNRRVLHGLPLPACSLSGGKPDPAATSAISRSRRSISSNVVSRVVQKVEKAPRNGMLNIAPKLVDKHFGRHVP